MASQIVLIEYTDLLFYPIKIRLEMAEIQSKVTKITSHGNYGKLAGGQLDGFYLASWVEARLHAKFQLPK